MSAPSLAERDAEYLKYGFLSIKAGNAIRTRLEGDALSHEEQEVLRHADELLRQISSGAELATSGNFQGNDVDPLASMEALDFARDPIRHIQGQVKIQQLAKLFASMAEAVETCSRSKGPPTPEQRDTLSTVASFFDALYRYVATTLDRRSGASLVTQQPGDPFLQQ